MKPLCSEISPPEEKNKNRPYTSSSGSGSCSGSRGASCSGSRGGSSSGSRSSTSKEGGERGEGKEGGVSLSLI